MNNRVKFCRALLCGALAVSVFSACQQEEPERPLTPDDLYDQGLSLEEIASRLNATELDPPELVDEENARIAATSEIIRFDDGGVCDIQNTVGLPGCTNGHFFDPIFSYFYTLEDAYFAVHQSLGPNKNLAQAGDQFYVILFLSDPNRNHLLASPGHFWTKYSMVASDVNKTVYFDLERIRHPEGRGITLWFLKDGRWRYWSRLGVGNWNLLPHTKGISQFQIRSSSGNSIDGYTIDDIVVSNIEER